MDIDDIDWEKYKHAYGKAVDVPDMLHDLEESNIQESFRNEIWDRIYSALCHQFTVFEASYAAFPFIVDIAEKKSPEHRIPALSLAATIAIFKESHSSYKIPQELFTPYEKSREKLKSLCVDCLSNIETEHGMREILAFISGAYGFARLGAGILLGEDEYDCEKCGNTDELSGYCEIPKNA